MYTYAFINNQASVPDKERIEDAKLVFLLTKMSSIEIQVQLDFFYKDVVSTYEETGEKATKDKDQTKTASTCCLFVSTSCAA